MILVPVCADDVVGSGADVLPSGPRIPAQCGRGRVDLPRVVMTGLDLTDRRLFLAPPRDSPAPWWMEPRVELFARIRSDARACRFVALRPSAGFTGVVSADQDEAASMNFSSPTFTALTPDAVSGRCGAGPTRQRQAAFRTRTGALAKPVAKVQLLPRQAHTGSAKSHWFGEEPWQAAGPGRPS